MTAAAAALACLLPAACDAAAASPAYHYKPPAAAPTDAAAHPAAYKSTGGYWSNKGGHRVWHPGTPPANTTTSAAAAPTSADATTDAAAPTSADATTDPAVAATATDTAATGTAAATTTVAATATNDATNNNNGLDVLARDCSKSKLAPHTGFQVAPACVSTAFGEVAAQDKDPSLLITSAPNTVAAKTAFTLQVSTRNLVRDRFLGAAVGGYYLESSVLTDGGLQRGHFHTACRMLTSTTEAPDPNPVPAFFLATQDNGGSATPDTVTISVTGMPTAGEAQCTVWAGDGSHRVPMMQRANQTPAIDSVRIKVT
ncbi:MAG TPA: hypothetical protein VGE11_05430 [Pseudonocardia sp.]